MSVSIVVLTVVCAVVQASDLPFPTFTSKVSVEIVAGDIRRHTASIKLQKNVSLRWDKEFVLYAFIHTYVVYMPNLCTLAVRYYKVLQELPLASYITI